MQSCFISEVRRREMNLQKLKYIVEIADCGSVTKASKKLFVSQPYLSKIVQDFEKQTKQQIFLRKNSGLELTDQGRKVYLLARSIIYQMELLDHLGDEDPPEEKDTKLSFSAANLIIKDHLLLDFFKISDTSRNHMDFFETTIHGCIVNVERNLSEFAIVAADDFQKSLLLQIAGHKGLEYRELDEGGLYYHLHRAHPLADQEKISIESLLKYPFVRLKDDEFTQFSGRKFRQEYPQVKVSKLIIVNHYHTYLSIVKNNGAFMIGNKWQISELEKMGIKSIRFTSSKHKMHLGIIKKTGADFSEEAAKFIRLFMESYGLSMI